jgi:hypothetical protein
MVAVILLFSWVAAMVVAFPFSADTKPQRAFGQQ